MKKLLSSRGLFLLGFAILVATNIIVLSGVAYNRSGEPESQITLTDRELQLPYQSHKENSGLALRLVWRAVGKAEDDNEYVDWRTPVWFSAEKLRELGFTINDSLSSTDQNRFDKHSIPKEVFIVLENNGEPYREAVKRAEMALEKKEKAIQLNPGDQSLREDMERADERLKRERTEETRLFAIDAGLDAGQLREKFSDRTRYMITKGLVEPRYDYSNKKKEVFGYISRLSASSIYVPLKQREVLDSILSRAKSKKNEFRQPRFEVTLAYGKRWEPWIVSVRSVDNE